MQCAPAAYERFPGAARSSLSVGYERRQPESTVLHGIVRAYLPALLNQAAERSEHAFGYPRFVEREFEKFLDCGVLERGFLRVKCADCPRERLIAFSCKTRGFCPSCTARRMAHTAAHLVDQVLPKVPYRQWVISFPKRVRFLLAKNHPLLSDVLAASLRKIFAWQKRKARALGIPAPMCGAISFVQRFGSLINLNCHFHCLLPDGVFIQHEGEVEFRPIPPPSHEDIDRLVQQIARATEKLIARRLESGLADEPLGLLHVEQAAGVESYRFPRSGPPNPAAGNRSSFFYGYSLPTPDCH